MTKPLAWFRLHTEFATDPVVQTLAFEDQRHFIMLLCFKASGLLDREFGNPQVRLDCIRKTLGLDGKAWDEMRGRLSAVGLIDSELQPVNWDKRQFVSDHDQNVTERVRKWRENKRIETATTSKRKCNGRATDEKPLPETETETETETEKSRAPKGSRFALTQLPADWFSFCRQERPDLDPGAMFEKFGDYWRGVPGAKGRKLDWPATWRNFVRSEKAVPAWAKPQQSPQQVAAEALRMMEKRDEQKRAA